VLLVDILEGKRPLDVPLAQRRPQQLGVAWACTASRGSPGRPTRRLRLGNAPPAGLGLRARGKAAVVLATPGSRKGLGATRRMTGRSRPRAALLLVHRFHSMTRAQCQDVSGASRTSSAVSATALSTTGIAGASSRATRRILHGFRLQFTFEALIRRARKIEAQEAVDELMGKLGGDLAVELSRRAKAARSD
jgi:hypothetical protein